MYDLQDAFDLGVRGALCADKCRGKTETLAVPHGITLRRDAAVYHDPDDHSFGFRDHECDHVPGRRGPVQCGNRNGQQYGPAEDKSGVESVLCYSSAG